MYKAVALAVMCVVSSGCDSYVWMVIEAKMRGERSHPHSRYFTMPMDQTSTLALSMPLRVSRTSQPSVNANAPLDVLPLSITLGELDGGPEETFGRIEDADIDAMGRIFVLDSYDHRVRVFTGHGTFVAGIGRSGRGPGEFAKPLSLALTDDGQVFVGDAAFRVHRFTWSDIDKVFEYQTSFSVDVEPHDLCVMGGAIYIHGVSPSHRNIIFVYDYSGRRRSSFGIRYRSGNFLVDHSISKGKLTCVEDAGTVVYASQFLFGGVQGYGTDGTPTWATTVAEYEPVSVVERGDGAVELAVPAGGMHCLGSLVDLQDWSVLFQVVYLQGGSALRPPEQGDSLISFILDARNGNGVRVGGRLGNVVAAGTDFTLSARKYPYPMLSIERRETMGASRVER